MKYMKDLETNINNSSSIVRYLTEDIDGNDHCATFIRIMNYLKCNLTYALRISPCDSSQYTTSKDLDHLRYMLECKCVNESQEKLFAISKFEQKYTYDMSAIYHRTDQGESL